MNKVNEDGLKEILKGSKLVVVDCFADWCAPCRALEPVLKDVGTEMADKVDIVKVDIDDQSGLADDMNIRSVPTILIFKEGKEVDRLIGAVPKTKLKAVFEKWL